MVQMFLEDKEEQEQFLLSELIDYVGVQLGKWMEVDWNSFSQRKSLVRVLQYVEQKNMLRVYDGSSQLVSQEISQEVLYENTGLSRYFAVTYPFDLGTCTCWQDFEKERLEELETDRGHFRIQRVYRRLAACPAMYWESGEDPDSLYLKNQRQWVEKYMKEQLGGRLELYRNAAFWVWRKRILTEPSTPGMHSFRKPYCWSAPGFGKKWKPAGGVLGRTERSGYPGKHFPVWWRHAGAGGRRPGARSTGRWKQAGWQQP